jgi:formate hydrogenlyase subunit 3/multisubunit Na+/H+ antiporter MnhD subunit
VSYPVLALLVGAPLVCGAAAARVGRGPAHLAAALAMFAIAGGAALARPDGYLAIGDAQLGLTPLARLELGFLAGVGALLAAYHWLSGRAALLPALLPPLAACVAAARLAGSNLLVAASFLLLAALLTSLVMIDEQPEWQASPAGAIYLTLTALGSLAVLFGFVLANLQRLSPGGLVTLPFVVAALSVGLALHWGVAPLHFWVPTAVQRAGPASAALAICLVGPAALGLVLQALAAQPQLIVDERVNRYLTGGGLFTAAFGAAAAFAPAPFRRTLGYVLVADMGLVLAGLATATRLGVAGAALHMAHRSLAALLLLGAAAELERDDRGWPDTAPTAADVEARDPSTETGGRGDAGPALEAPPEPFEGRSEGTRARGEVATRAGRRCPRGAGGAGRPVAGPYMWGTLLVGSLALTGAPPLGGFAANWAIYQAASLSDWRLSMALAAAEVACLAALVAALGRRRREYPRPWRRPRAVEWFLMALCAAVGLWGMAPGPALGAVHGAVGHLAFLKPF